MGFFSKLFGKGDDADSTTEEAAPRAINREVRREQLTELGAALGALREAMLEDGNPVNNPGWMGRVRDFAGSRADVAALIKRDFTHDDLNEVLCSIRPLYRGAAPEHYQHLVEQNTRVQRAIDALYATADGE